MKKYIFLFLLLTLVLCYSSCTFNFGKPDTATTAIIEEKEYKKAFIGELYPGDEFAPNDGVKVSENLYYQYSETPYDCYIAYDRNAEPNVYFEIEKFDEATSYYSDSNNYKFFCLLGNVHDTNQQKILEIQKIDYLMFNQLLEFSSNNNYNLFAAFTDEDGLKKVPIPNPDNWTADEIHFYKESNDGAFGTSKGYTFILLDDKLCFLYRYDFGDDDVPVMLVRSIPSEVSDYFCSLLKELQN